LIKRYGIEGGLHFGRIRKKRNVFVHPPKRKKHKKVRTQKLVRKRVERGKE